ncbi:disulfide bond formation protein DsbB, partial [Shewanella sp.]
AWLILMLSALGLEAIALYFQYVMLLDPCVMCIYIRVAVLGLFIAGLIGSLAPKLWLARFVGMAIWGVSAAWGAKLSYELYQMQAYPSPFATCSFYPEFPTWMPLDAWMPSVFMPTGMCSDIPWTLLSLSMAQWTLLAFTGYCIAFIVMLYPGLIYKKSTNPYN